MLATFAQVNDVRPILATVRSINPDDLPAAWEEYKNRFKQQVHAEQEELAKQQSSKGNLAARLLGSRRNSASSAQKPVSMFELIEQACREERTMFAKQFDSLKEMKKQQEAEHLRQIEEMKSKNLKMADYIGMQYNGVPPNQQPQQ